MSLYSTLQHYLLKSSLLSPTYHISILFINIFTQKAVDYKNNLFQHPEITRIVGEPTTTTSISLQAEKQDNVPSVQTVLGSGISQWTYSQSWRPFISTIRSSRYMTLHQFLKNLICLFQYHKRSTWYISCSKMIMCSNQLYHNGIKRNRLTKHGATSRFTFT